MKRPAPSLDLLAAVARARVARTGERWSMNVSGNGTVVIDVHLGPHLGVLVEAPDLDEAVAEAIRKIEEPPSRA